MKEIYYGLINYENKKTKEKSIIITDTSDSPVLIAKFIEDHFLNKEILILDFEIKEDLIDKKYFDLFKSKNKDSTLIIKDELIPFEIETEDEYTFLDSLFCLPDYEHKDKDDIVDMHFMLNNDRSDIIFLKYHNSKNNINCIENFKNLDTYSKYKDVVDEVIKLSCLDEEDGFIQIIDKNIDNLHPDFTIAMNESFIKNIVKEKWNNQIDFIKKLYDKDNLFLTINSIHNEEVGTFGEDNKEFILSFIKDQIKNAEYTNELENIGFVVVIRQFTNIIVKKNIPEKRIAMCLINENGIHPISKKDTMEASLTCYQTGNKIKKEKGDNYISFEKMIGLLNINILNLD